MSDSYVDDDENDNEYDDVDVYDCGENGQVDDNNNDDDNNDEEEDDDNDDDDDDDNGGDEDDDNVDDYDGLFAYLTSLLSPSLLGA